MSLKLVLLCVMLPSVLYPCYKLWSRAIVQTSCTYDDLTLTNTQISTVVSWVRLMGLCQTNPPVVFNLGKNRIDIIPRELLRNIQVYMCTIVYLYWV